MRLIFLGTTGYHPNDSRHTACLLLPEAGVMLDAGTGMFRAGRHLRTATLDIFLTHAHLDHVVGLTYLFNVVRERALERVRVHALPEKLAALDEHLFAPALFPVRPPMTFVSLEPEVALPDGGRLTWFPLIHHGGSIGFRLDWPGRSLAYVTDTSARPDAEYVERIRGATLLVHECYFPDAQADWAAKTGHSHLTPTLETARRAEVGRLVLVHVDPFLDRAEPLDLAAAREIFPRVELGRDGMEVDF